MWRIILLVTCVLWGGTNADPRFNSFAGYRNLKKREAGSYGGSYSNSFAGNGGYLDNYNDYDGGGFVPDIGLAAGFLDPYKFSQLLTSQIMAQYDAHQNAIATTIARGDATVTAAASNLPNGIQDYNEILERQQDVLFNSLRQHQRNSYNSKDSTQDTNRYAPNYSAAAASASVGPKGGYQTAFISPENPAIPNIINRFSPATPDGFKSVSVSSFSSNVDVDGKKTSSRGSQTSFNDNGHITTYKVVS